MSTNTPHSYQLGAAATVAALLALLLLVLAGRQHTAAPQALAATAPPAVFSAARAAVTLQGIASRPHPTGTAENAQVRDYLLGALRALGLDPQVQSGFAVAVDDESAGTVHNIVVRLPGSRPGKAVLLMAHYDSAPHSPGAADDGASVAAIVETLRALRAGAPLQNDIVCLISDGEEAGLLGARLFLEKHPLASQVGVAFNFEYRGNDGPFWMFETSPGNAQVVQGFASAVAHPLGNSLLNEVYKLMPNDTDLTVFKRAGIPALNFAAGKGYTSYHTQLDSPERLNPGSLQHEGDIMLALARHFGNAPVPARSADDAIYADLPLLGLAAYGAGALLPLGLLAAGLLAAAIRTGSASGALRIGRVLAGVPLFLLAAGLTGLLCQWAWSAILWLHPQYRLMLHGTPYNSELYLLFFMALALGLFLLSRRHGPARAIRPLEAALAAMLVWAALLACASVVMPGASFALTWPLLPMLVALNLVLNKRIAQAHAAIRIAILVAGAAPGLILLPPLLELVYDALTPVRVYVPVLLLVLFLGMITPLLEALGERAVLRGAPFVLALACLGLAASSAGFDSARPQPNNLFYVQHAAIPQAYWASTDQELDSWTRTVFPHTAKARAAPELFGPSTRQFWLSPAPAAGVKPPLIKVLDDRGSASVRTVVLEVQSQRMAPKMTISVDGARVEMATVQGRAFPSKAHDDWRIETFGMGNEVVRLELTLGAGKPLRIRARDISYGLEQAGIAPRPPSMLIQPFRNSDTVQGISVAALP